MANLSVISPEAWQEVRRAVELGMTFNEAAAYFGVEWETIRKRAYREDWLTPQKLQKLAAERAEERAKLANNGEESTNVPKGGFLASEGLLRVKEGLDAQNRLGLARAAGKGIETALAKMDSGEIEVSSLQDLQTIANIAKIAWGGDSAQQAVQVNILNDSACSVEHGDFPVFEAE